MSRVDDQGRAFAGSQLQMQIYVNRRPAELAQAVGLKTGLDAESIEWVSPLEKDLFREVKDREFLETVGCGEHAAALAEFWPQRGPVWDGLGKVSEPSKGVILLEGKSHLPEIFGNGCQAAPKSKEKILSALAKAKEWAKADPAADWTGPLYQSANRLAHLYFFREVLGVPTWMVNVHFIDDPHSPTSLEEWHAGLSLVKKQLGLTSPMPYTADVFLPACRRIELLEAP